MRRGGALLALATALLAAGCGTGGISKSSDSDKGKTLFLAKCSGCHTLADAVAAYVAMVAGKPVASKNTTSGKDIFTANCGSCHTLKDAGTNGTVGPNLDQLKPSLEIVQHQVINGGGAMPAFKGTLTPAQITAVAKYVSSAAGR